jgi:hypothetical protein
VSRLEAIANRNKHPWKLKGMLSFGLRSLFLLVILGLLIFTNWAISPEDKRPGINVVPAPSKDRAVRDVKLWSPPAKK